MDRRHPENNEIRLLGSVLCIMVYHCVTTENPLFSHGEYEKKSMFNIIVLDTPRATFACKACLLLSAPYHLQRRLNTSIQGTLEVDQDFS